MKKALYILTILLLLPACGTKQQDAQKAKERQAAAADAEQSSGDSQSAPKESSYKQALFLRAVNNEDIEAVRQFLADGVDVNDPMEDGSTAIRMAIWQNNPELVELLIAGGANLETRDSWGNTPLHEACTGCLEIVRLLVAERVDLNAKNEEGETPLHIAAQAEEAYGYQIAKILIENGADVNAKDKEGSTPLDKALEGNPHTANLLVRHGGTTTKTIESIPVAAILGDIAKVRSLIAAGKDIEEREWGRTALHYAAEMKYREIVRILIAHGAEVNAKTRDFVLTPLHLAAMTGRTDIAELLIAGGADVNAMGGSFSMDTPLDEARSEDMKKLLRRHGALTSEEVKKREEE
jgi:ankyrin repeat protein